MDTIVITSLKSAEMKSLRAYLSGQGYQVLTPPEDCRVSTAIFSCLRSDREK